MALVDEILRQLEGGGIGQIAGQLGIDQAKVSRVAAGAVPALITALAGNASTSSGRSSLASALDRDHDGSILDDVAGFLGGGGGGDVGSGILRHVFGSKQSSLSQALGGASGLDASSVTRILAMLAPLVMGALGKAKRARGLDADGLASMLGAEKKAAAQAAPDAIGMLSKMLDADGDGSVVDDVTNLLGGLFGKK
jgi:hypothetical protein